MNVIAPAALPAVVMSLVPVARGEEGDLQPLRATIEASEVLVPTGQPGVFDVAITGTGQGTLFGNLTFSATETIDFVSNRTAPSRAIRSEAWPSARSSSDSAATRRSHSQPGRDRRGLPRPLSGRNWLDGLFRRFPGLRT